MIYDEKKFMEYDYKIQAEIRGAYPFSYHSEPDAPGVSITRQKVRLVDLLELKDKIFILAFQSSNGLVSLSGYIGNVRLECTTTTKILADYGVEVK